jgi:hypothetical protein
MYGNFCRVVCRFQVTAPAHDFTHFVHMVIVKLTVLKRQYRPHIYSFDSLSRININLLHINFQPSQNGNKTLEHKTVRSFLAYAKSLSYAIKVGIRTIVTSQSFCFVAAGLEPVPLSTIRCLPNKQSYSFIATSCHPPFSLMRRLHDTVNRRYSATVCLLQFVVVYRWWW